MKWIILILFTLLVPVTEVQAQDAWGVSVCSGCNNRYEFESAGRQVAGSGFNGIRTILVINPDTNVSRYVDVDYMPDGTYPQALPSQPRAYIHTGTSVLMPASSSNDIITADELRAEDSAVMGGSTTATSRPVSSGESQEIGALIEFGRNTFIVTFPMNSDYFGSFTGREPAAVANYIYSQMTQTNPGWATRQLSNRLRKLVLQRLSIAFGKSQFSVCGIFNNGDSACFEPDAATPSLENYISGSAKTKEGTGIAWGGSSGGSGGNGLVVDSSQGPQQYGWGVNAGGDVWLICSFINGVLHSCYIE